MTAAELALAALAAAAAGLVNALAGGGTLVSFPVLLALGVPPIAANLTNAVALCPGYLGAALAQRGQLRAQRRRLWLCVPAALAGGAAGACILLATQERTFQLLVPYMIAAAALLVAAQERVRAWVLRRLARQQQAQAQLERGLWAVGAVLLAAMYGGFFSAGLGVILLGLLGLTLDESLTRLNALKQAVSLAVNLAATLIFLFSGQVLWLIAAVMAVGAWFGGVLGGRIADRMRPTFLRWTVVVTALLVALAYWAVNVAAAGGARKGHVVESMLVALGAGTVPG